MPNFFQGDNTPPPVLDIPLLDEKLFSMNTSASKTNDKIVSKYSLRDKTKKVKKFDE
jgi:hypothetical protein